MPDRSRAAASVKARLALVRAGNAAHAEGDLVVHVLDGVLQVPALAPGLRFDSAHWACGRQQVGLAVSTRPLCATCDLVGLLVELREQIALVHAVVVVDQNPRDLAGDARRDEGDVPVHVGVIGRNRVEGLLDIGNAEYEDRRQGERADGAAAAVFASWKADGRTMGRVRAEPERLATSPAPPPDSKRLYRYPASRRSWRLATSS